MTRNSLLQKPPALALVSMSWLLIMAAPLSCGSPVVPQCRDASDCEGAGVPTCVDRRCVFLDAPNDVGDDVADVSMDTPSDDVSTPDVPTPIDIGPEDVDPSMAPRISVSPESLDFGEAGLLVSRFADLTVSNIGPGPLEIRSITLRNPRSRAFDLLQPLERFESIPPDKFVVYRVRFQPTLLVGESSSYTNDIHIISNDPLQNFLSVSVNGTALPKVEHCINLTRKSIDFGFVPVGSSQSSLVTLVNCGTSPSTISSVELEGDVPGLVYSLTRELPFVLQPNERVLLIVAYDPQTTLIWRARLVILSEEGGRAEYGVQGGPTCPVAKLRLTAGGLRGIVRVTGVAGEGVDLSAVESVDLAGGPLEYTWTVTPPEGSTSLQVDPDLTSESLSIVPDVGGIYQVKLDVRSQASSLASCEPATGVLDIFPNPAPVEINLAWEGDADLDLHLLQSDADGTYSAFGYVERAAYNCYDAFYDNTFPDLGKPQESWDNPKHLGDEPNNETVLLGRIDPTRRYKVGIQYALPDSSRAPVTASLEVRVDGRTQIFEETLDQLSSYWVPLEIDGSTRRVTPIGLVEPAAAEPTARNVCATE